MFMSHNCPLVKLKNSTGWSQIISCKYLRPSQRDASAELTVIILQREADLPAYNASAEYPEASSTATWPHSARLRLPNTGHFHGLRWITATSPPAKSLLWKCFTLMTREAVMICHYRNTQWSGHWVMTAASCPCCHQSGLRATHLSWLEATRWQPRKSWLPAPSPWGGPTAPASGRSRCLQGLLLRYVQEE